MPLLAFPFYILIIYISVKFVPSDNPERAITEKEIEKFSGTSPTRSRRDLLILLRIAAALLVFIMHTGMTFGIDAYILLSHHSWLLFSPAWLGMVIFFTLSGYLMGKIFTIGRYTLTSSGISGYYKSRLLRIIPAAFFVIILVISALSPKSWLDFSFITRIFSFTYNGSGDGIAELGLFWSLTTEMQYYLIVPALTLLASLYLKSNKAKLIVIFAIYILGCALRLIIFSHFNFDMGHWYLYVYSPLYGNIDLFLGGFMLSKVSILRIPKFKLLAPSVISIAVATYLAYSYISYQAMKISRPKAIPIFGILLPAATSILTLFLIYGLENLSKAWIKPSKIWWPALRLFAPLTYSFYITNAAVMITINRIYSHNSIGFKLLLSYPIILLTAVLLFYGIEKRFHMGIKR